jgi:serine/threonine-protein kinase HipA
MASKVKIYLFKKHIADMYQDGDSVYLKQIETLAYKASPLSISSNQEIIETTHLVFQDRVAGFISDSLPGSFGNEILENFFLAKENKRPTIIDKLLFIGDSGLGAITFKPSIEIDSDTSETLKLKDMFEEAKKIKKQREFHSLHSAFMVAAHSFVGGARSKAVCGIDLKTKTVYLGSKNQELPKGYIHAIIKYDDTAGDDENKSTYSKIEYIYHLLALKSGINMEDCYLLEADGKHHFVTKRFDIDNRAQRYHVHSLAGLLHLDYNMPRAIGYEDLLRTAVKLSATNSIEQLLLQMLFNYMFVNQDDHIRNFSFMCDESFKWRATPAYDITFAKGKQQTVEHQLSLYGKPLSLIDLTDVTKLATEFGISMEFLANSIETMKHLRNEELPTLLAKYNVSKSKQSQLLSEVKQRTFQGELDE